MIAKTALEVTRLGLNQSQIDTVCMHMQTHMQILTITQGEYKSETIIMYMFIAIPQLHNPA